MKKYLITIISVVILSVLYGVIFEPTLMGSYIFGCIVGTIATSVYPLYTNRGEE